MTPCDPHDSGPSEAGKSLPAASASDMHNGEGMTLNDLPDSDPRKWADAPVYPPREPFPAWQRSMEEPEPCPHGDVRFACGQCNGGKP